ncbi:MAG: SDR family oxidoreductase [Acidobacteriota bacterium]
MRILIAGCGDVGTRLGLLLAADGHQVWGVRRRPERLPEGIQGLAADLTDRASLAALPQALDQVYYTAAADRSTEEAYRQAYVDGLRNVLSAVGESPRRLVFVSSTSVYGQTDGSWVDEGSPTEPRSFRGRLILEAEAVLAERAQETVTVRFAGIYGPGRTRLIDSVRRGEAVCYDDPPLYTNRIHVDDCAAVLRHLGGLRSVPGIVLGVDHAPTPDGEVKRWLARRQGVAEPPEAGDRPATRPRPVANKRCSNRWLVDSGYRFLYADYRAGYGAMLDGG